MRPTFIEIYDLIFKSDQPVVSISNINIIISSVRNSEKNYS